MTVIGTASFEDGHDDAGTVPGHTTRCYIPGEVRINVVIARLDVVPLLAAWTKIACDLKSWMGLV